jgi:hypothetical protein
MGSGASLIGQDSIPAPSDAVNIPADFAAFTADIDHKLIHFVADVNERDVFFAAAAAPIFVMSPSSLWCKISGSGGSSVWVTIWGDSGAVTASVTPGTDFDTLGGYVRKIEEKFVIFSVQLVRRNSSIALNNHTAGSPGNIAGDPTMCIFPVGFRPDNGFYVGTWRSGTTNGAYRINTSGALGLYSGNPGTTIVQDDQIEASGCFIVA